MANNISDDKKGSTMNDKEIYGQFVSKSFCESMHNRNDDDHNKMDKKLDTLISYFTDNGKPSVNTRIAMLEEWKARQDGWIKGILKATGPYAFILIAWGILYYLELKH